MNELNQPIDSIIDNFNENMRKKELLRLSKISDLQDSITDQVEKRLSKYADAFSNKDLIDYFKVFQDTLQKTDTSNVPSNINITQNQLNIGLANSEFSQDERKRILSSVLKVLALKNQNNEELVVVNDDR